jgi:hypothetical protein
MRDILLLLLAGGALIFSVLSYQRVEELSEIIARLDTETSRQTIDQNRVLSLGRRLEQVMRSVPGLRKSDAKPQ